MLETFLNMNFGPMRTKNADQNDFKLKNEVFMSQLILQFYASYSFAPSTYKQSHFFTKLYSMVEEHVKYH